MLRALCLALAMVAMPAIGQAPDPVPPPPAPPSVPLWPNGAPGSEQRRSEAEVSRDYWVMNVHNPSLTVFPADPNHRNGTAIIVIPGGAHKFLVYTTEGTAAAQPLNRMGITAFVLKYRLAKSDGSAYTVERDEMRDVRRAIRWVRAHASDYGIDPHRIGIMGFSAGGELANLAANNRPAEQDVVRDSIDRESARPDFQVLVFPGPLGVPANDIAHAPPAFITAGSLDKCCAAPAVELYEQMRKARVPAELHMYANADHAFNLGEASNLLSIIHWPDRLADWLADEGFLDGSSTHLGVNARAKH
jgi:acetyl esterase/lipase